MHKIYFYLTLLTIAAAGVYLYGNQRYNAGQRALIEKIETARAESKAQKKEIEDEIDGLSDAELLERALEYVRTDSGG